jgi:hypothetical protein
MRSELDTGSGRSFLIQSINFLSFIVTSICFHVLLFTERRVAMSYKNFTTFASILAFIFALGFILMPNRLLSFYNVTVNDAGTLIAQLFGATLLGFGLLNWLGRDFDDVQAQQALTTANFATDTVGFIFAVLGQLGGVSGVNSLGWSTVLIYLILAAGFGFLRFLAK